MTERVLTCLGDNSAGQIGNGTTQNKSIPEGATPLAHGLSGLDQRFFLTAQNVYALDPAGRAAWGAGTSGQIGDGTVAATVTLPEQLTP